MPRNINALIEGGLPQTMGFTPTENNHSQRDHETWLKWRLQVAKIPVVAMRPLMGVLVKRYVLECECPIAEFNERCHNSGLRFSYSRPAAGTSRSCWVEVEAIVEA